MGIKRFHRMGRSCPVKCKETCCFICDNADGAMDFGPGTEFINCAVNSDKNTLRDNHGQGCTSFKRHKFGRGGKP